MNLSLLLGLILAFAAVAAYSAIYTGAFSSAFSPSAFILIVGGVLGAAFMSFSVKQVFSLPGILRGALKFRFNEAAEETAETIVSLADKARKEGFLSLDRERGMKSVLLAEGIGLVVDGMSAEDIKEILEARVEVLTRRYKTAEKVLASMARYAPALGVAGLAIMLTGAMSRSTDPSLIGKDIASAFVPVLYGVVVSNLILAPLGARLRTFMDETSALDEMIIEGVLAIQSGCNPRIVRMRMSAFTPDGKKKKRRVSNRVESPEVVEWKILGPAGEGDRVIHVKRP